LNIGANEKQRVRCFWSISSGAQYVTLQKYLSYLSLVIYSFPIPPIKPELGLQIGGRLLMAIQLDQSNYLAYQEHQVLGIAVPFTSISILRKNAGRLNPFCRAKPTGFEFSSSNFIVRDHILITSGVAVRSLRRRIREKRTTMLPWACALPSRWYAGELGAGKASARPQGLQLQMPKERVRTRWASCDTLALEPAQQLCRAPLERQ